MLSDCLCGLLRKVQIPGDNSNSSAKLSAKDKDADKMAVRSFLSVKNFVRRMAALFREKPSVQIDEIELEHLMFYHGLIGTSPQDQPSFKDIKLDLTLAIRAKSPLQMAIALKLSPLYFEDKLTSYFADLDAAEKEAALITLLPNTDNSPWPNNHDPLGHEDWRVRSNAALILSSLGHEAAIERIIDALNDTANNGKPSFFHFTRALAKLGGERARKALIAHINNREQWFQIDVAAALAHWPLAMVAQPLTQIVLASDIFADYLAVSVSCHHPPLALLENESEAIQDIGCQIVIGLIEAGKQTFANDPLLNVRLSECLDRAYDLALHRRNPRSVRAALTLAKWLGKSEQIEVIRNNDEITATLSKIIRSVNSLGTQPTAIQSNEIKHAIKLCGAFKLSQLVPDLLALAANGDQWQDEIIQALADIGDSTAATELVKLAYKLVNIEDRIVRAKSKQSVEEENPQAAKTYWLILKALGSMPSPAAEEFLCRAVHDFAPDKRQEALISLGRLAPLMAAEQKSKLKKIVQEALADSAAPVQVAALQLVPDLNGASFPATVLALSRSKEPSINRQAFATFATLLRNGDQEAEAVLKKGIATEFNTARRERLMHLLTQLR